jgi:NTE family protein
MFHFKTASILFFLLLCISQLSLGGQYSHDSANRPKVAVVFGGSGAHGVAHLGVLQELERQRVPIDLIVGSGFGGIVGGLYASGMSVEAVHDFLLKTD